MTTDEPEPDIRDRLRAWATAHLIDGANEMIATAKCPTAESTTGGGR